MTSADTITMKRTRHTLQVEQNANDNATVRRKTELANMVEHSIINQRSSLATALIASLDERFFEDVTVAIDQ